jgi:hypothetical protein
MIYMEELETNKLSIKPFDLLPTSGPTMPGI